MKNETSNRNKKEREREIFATKFFFCQKKVVRLSLDISALFYLREKKKKKKKKNTRTTLRETVPSDDDFRRALACDEVVFSKRRVTTTRFNKRIGETERTQRTTDFEVLINKCSNCTERRSWNGNPPPSLP